VGLGRGLSPAGSVMPESPLLFSRSCLWFLPPSTVEKSRSQRVEELGSQPSNLSFGSQLGRRWAIPGPPDSSISPAPELSEQAGRHDSEKKHRNNTNEASMLLKTQKSSWKRS
jgi:hypothetical protein